MRVTVFCFVINLIKNGHFREDIVVFYQKRYLSGGTRYETKTYGAQRGVV